MIFTASVLKILDTTLYIHVDAKLLTAVFISVDFDCNFQTYVTQQTLYNSASEQFTMPSVTTDTDKFDFYYVTPFMLTCQTF
jgi:hypothetical protein